MLTRDRYLWNSCNLTGIFKGKLALTGPTRFRPRPARRPAERAGRAADRRFIPLHPPLPRPQSPWPPGPGRARRPCRLCCGPAGRAPPQPPMESSLPARCVARGREPAPPARHLIRRSHRACGQIHAPVLRSALCDSVVSHLLQSATARWSTGPARWPAGPARPVGLLSISSGTTVNVRTQEAIEVLDIGKIDIGKRLLSASKRHILNPQPNRAYW